MFLEVEKMSEETKEKSRVTYERICEHCGRTFTAYRMDAKFCSSRCYGAYRRSQLPPLVKKCKWCGKEFMRPRALGGKYKYCSDECAAAALQKQERDSNDRYLAKLRAANAARLMVKCVICGKEFFSPRGTAKYCSPRCKCRSNNIKDAARMKRRAALLEAADPEDREAIAKSFSKWNKYERNYRKHFDLGCLLGISKNGLDDIGDAVFEPLEVMA